MRRCLHACNMWFKFYSSQCSLDVISELEDFHGWVETLWFSFGVRTEHLLEPWLVSFVQLTSVLFCFFFCYSFWESCIYILKFAYGWSYFGLRWWDPILCCRTHDNCLPGIIPAGLIQHWEWVKRPDPLIPGLEPFLFWFQTSATERGLTHVRAVLIIPPAGRLEAYVCACSCTCCGLQVGG